MNNLSKDSESESFSISRNDLEALLASVLRKYLPKGRKIELDLLKSSREVDLDIYITAEGKAKISWSDA